MKDELLVVITGATRGCGRAMALRFAELGHTVAGCGTNESAVAKICSELPEPHFFRVVDVRDEGAVRQWADDLLARSGAPDILINNAAVINPYRPLWEVSGEDFDRVVDVNIKGVANVIRAFVPAMIARGKGKIVNFSSGWGRSTSADVAPYCATKWAMEGLSQAMAQELPKGLAVYALNPGIIDTDMLRSFMADGAAAYPKPEKWAVRAVECILGLLQTQSGKPISV